MAAASGVGAGTVSRVTSGASGVRGASCAKVLAAELLALPDPPSAIFASGTQAVGVLAAAGQSGTAVQLQLSVIGFDDNPLAALVGLSTVRRPLEHMRTWPQATRPADTSGPGKRAASAGSTSRGATTPAPTPRWRNDDEV